DFLFQAEDGIRDFHVTGVQTCALPILISLLKLQQARGFLIEVDASDRRAICFKIGSDRCRQFCRISRTLCSSANTCHDRRETIRSEESRGGNASRYMVYTALTNK